MKNSVVRTSLNQSRSSIGKLVLCFVVKDSLVKIQDLCIPLMLISLWFFGVQFRESEGAFQFGHMRREADDLHAVIQHFSGSNHVVSAIFGHSKGG